MTPNYDAITKECYSHFGDLYSKFIRVWQDGFKLGKAEGLEQMQIPVVAIGRIAGHKETAVSISDASLVALFDQHAGTDIRMALRKIYQAGWDDGHCNGLCTARLETEKVPV